MAAQPAAASTPPPCFVSSANSVPLSRSLMKISNIAGPSTDPWSASLVTGLQLDYVPLSLAAQVSIHLTIHLSSSYHCSLSMGRYGRQCQKTFYSGDKKHWLLSIHQGSHLAVEGYQVGQVQYPTHTNMLTAPSHLFVLEMVSRIICSTTLPGIKVKLTALWFPIYKLWFPKYKADWPVVP